MVQRCSTCGRFRDYQEGDRFCRICGSEALEAQCACGRPYDYAMAEDGDLHCPRCGRRLRGRSNDFEE